MRREDFRPYNREIVIKLAGQALTAAMHGDMRLAADYTESATKRHGLLDCVIAWCDTFIARIHPEHVQGQQFRIAWTVDGSGEVNWDAETVRQTARWAGRVIAARAAMDEDQFVALLKAPKEGAELGDCVAELLSMVAIGINNALAGA